MIIAATLSTYMEETDDFDKAVELLKQDGFNAVGIFINQEFDYYHKLKDKLKNLDIPICIHADINDTNIASLNKGIREESIKQVKQTIDFAEEINAKVVTIHPGKYRNKHKEQEAYEILANSLKEIKIFIKDKKTKVAIENMDHERDLCVKVEDIQKVLEQHPGLGFCLDIAHAALVQKDFLEYWDVLFDKVCHVHISGINRTNSHVEVSLKESVVDFSSLIKELGKHYKGIIRIENRTREKNIESLNFIKNIIEK